MREAVRAGGWPVTFSVGAATFEGPRPGLDESVKAVDDLMYEVKREGKNRIRHLRT